MADSRKTDHADDEPKHYVSVKIEASVYRMVKTVAAWEDINIADLLTEIVRPAIARRAAKTNREMRGQAQGENE